MADLEHTFAGLARHAPGELRRGEPLAPRTSVRVGGTADVFYRPEGADALVAALRILAADAQPWHVLGGGANTLVSDDGVRGVVIRLPPSGPESIARLDTGVRVVLAAGAPIGKLIEAQRQEGAVGAEFLAAVPGTIGGAVAMNAGTRHGWTQSVLESVVLASAEGLHAVAAKDLVFSYRHTALPAGSVLWSATFLLPWGDVAGSEKTMADDIAYRRRTQPLNLPNSGSVFKNPPASGAGRLIEEAGLRGSREGGAQISELHANFIVNRGGARASEVLALMRRAQAEVSRRSGVVLEPEVKLVGAFDR